jgi:hypothetical protein
MTASKNLIIIALLLVLSGMMAGCSDPDSTEAQTQPLAQPGTANTEGATFEYSNGLNVSQVSASSSAKVLEP